MKKFLALLLALAMMLALVACGGTGDTGTDAEGTADDTATTEDSTTDTETTDDAAQTEETGDAAGATGTAFKIGGIGPLTGANATYGNAAMNGAQIAVNEINALGGDIQFEFQVEDDVGEAETSVNAYHALTDWGMQALIGPVTTTPSIAVAAEAYADRVLALTPSASSTDVTAGRDNMFQICFTDPNQGLASADYIAANMPDSTIGILYRNDDAYSQGIRDSFVAEAEVQGLNVAYEGTFTEDTQTDFSVQLAAAQAAGVDLLFLPIYYTPASVVLNQANSMGYAPTFFGVDGMDGILTLEGFDTSLAEGVMLLTPFSATDEAAADFVATYEANYGETPNQFAADGYDAVYALYAAIQQAGVTADMSAAEICEALIPAMTEITVDGLTGTLSWSANGEVSKEPAAYIIQNGEYVAA